MATVLLWAVTVLYAGQGIIWICSRNYPLAAVMGGYVLANLGLIWSVG